MIKGEASEGEDQMRDQIWSNGQEEGVRYVGPEGSTVITMGHRPRGEWDFCYFTAIHGLL